MNLKRDFDVKGINIPYFFRSFIIERNCGALIPIINHNFSDVVNLVRIFDKLLNWGELDE